MGNRMPMRFGVGMKKQEVANYTYKMVYASGMRLTVQAKNLAQAKKLAALVAVESDGALVSHKGGRLG